MPVMSSPQSREGAEDKKKNVAKKKNACDELAPGEGADDEKKTVADSLPSGFGSDVAVSYIIYIY